MDPCVRMKRAVIEVVFFSDEISWRLNLGFELPNAFTTKNGIIVHEF